MEGFTIQQIKDLQQLIAPPRDDSDSDSDEENLRQRLSRQKLCPSDIGKANATTPSETETPATAVETGVSVKSVSQQQQKIVSNSDIWHPSEVNASMALPCEDPRIVPKYEMKFKQAVGTEDIFLGMNLKTPATASCEWMSLVIQLPGEQRERVELSVEADVVDLRSPRYRLQLPTPHPVDPNGSSAKWHSDRECLEITLKLSRELDDVNF